MFILADADTTSHIKIFIDGVSFFALATCIMGILVSSALWALGSKGQNPGQELTGKRGLIVSVVAAFLIGCVPTILAFADYSSRQAGSQGGIEVVQPTGGNLSPDCTLQQIHDGTC